LITCKKKEKIMALDWGSAAGGALSGAGTGATIGSVVPGVGTGLGAGIGAGVGGLAGLFGGLDIKEKLSEFDRFSPEQKALLSQILSALTGEAPTGGLLGQAFDTSALERPALRQFYEKTIPSLAERFAGAGAGAQSSSAFQQALGQAGVDLSERLAAMAQQQRMGLLGPLLGLGLTPQSDRYFQPSGPSGLAQGLGAISGGIGQGLGTGLGAQLAKGMQTTPENNQKKEP
jgi:hypothetical protein